MNALLEHVWGHSPATDRVWEQVTGMPPSRAVRQVLMALQAFIDDSSGQNGTYVIGGYVASAESWAKFATEWERLLPSGTLAKNGKYHFKMNEMAALAERMDRVPAFFRVIEQHVAMAVHVKLNVADLERAKARIWVPAKTINWGFIAYPFIVSFRCLLDYLYGHREMFDTVLPPGEQIDFIFDDQTEKKMIWKVWDEFVETRPDNYRANASGSPPRFENDQKFLGLQAADFWAWWVRKWYEDGTPEKCESMDFGFWKVNRRDFPHCEIAYDEDKLVKMLIGLLSGEYPDLTIWDLAHLPKSRWPLGPIL